MKLTMKELKDALVEHYDECDLLDVLGLTTHDLVKAFSSVIEHKAEYLISEMELLSEGYLDEDEMVSYEDDGGYN